MTELEDKIYKDLTYTQTSYYMAEQIYPYWENIFAVIVGAFFVTYFNDSLNANDRLLLAVIGFLFAVSWFLLVSRNFLFSLNRGARIKMLENALKQTVKLDDEKSITLFNLIEYLEENNKLKHKWHNKFPTWSIRRLLPLFLTIIWLILIVYSFFK